jgi:S1-C subfamily serine protease
VERRRWFRRSPPPPEAATSVCPRCGFTGPVRLFGGAACGACKAQDAWSQLDGERLVIDRGSIDEAIRRRRGEAAGQPVWRRLLAWIPPALALALALAAAWTAVRLLSSRPIGPLAALLAELSSASRHALIAGASALVVGAPALVLARRSRHFRRLPLLACYLAAIVTGATAVAIGGFHARVPGFGGAHTRMPARESLGVPMHAERIADASVVVLAPDADGDARHGALGTGAVVATDAHRAWIVTCSHVAIPYVTTGARRRPRDARPVWVQLADGREGPAIVMWSAPPPLDVVLLEMAIDHPPAPVPIAADASALVASSPVTFVPNPLRSGWMVVRGEVIRRETHHTPAGAYDLVITDLPVTHGDSGSGLYDARGQLVGLNTWTRVSDGAAQGLSLPSEALRVAIDAIRTGRLDELKQQADQQADQQANQQADQQAN